MTNSTLERERIKTANPPPIAGPLGAHPVGTANSIDPNAEESYWRENYSSRPYVTSGTTFNEYRPAYRYGVESYRRYEGRSFEQAEPELMSDWNRVKGTSSLTWENAKHAARDSWQRVSDFAERATPGDSDHDGK
jgi:hypothetical protein